MLAKNNPDIQEAVTTIYQLTEDEKIRQMCERRQKALFDQRDLEHKLKQADTKISQLTSEKKQLTSKVEHLSSAYNQMSSENEQLTSEVEHLKQLLKDHNIDLNT